MVCLSSSPFHTPHVDRESEAVFEHVYFKYSNTRVKLCLSVFTSNRATLECRERLHSPQLKPRAHATLLSGSPTAHGQHMSARHALSHNCQ